MRLDSVDEVWKGATDIPTAILAVVFGLLLIKKENREWALLFFLVAAASMTGAFVHMFRLGRTATAVIWVFLYGMLFGLLYIFYRLITSYITGEKYSVPTVITAAGAVLYVVACVLTFLNPSIDIYALVLFSLILIVSLASTIIRKRSVGKKIIILAVLLALALACQAAESFLRRSVVCEHIIFVFALIVAYLTASENTVKEKIT